MNKILSDIKFTFSIFLSCIFFCIITNNTNGQEQKEDNLENWLNKNKNSIQSKMFEKEIIDRIAGSIVIEYGTNDYYKDFYQFKENLSSYMLGISIFMTSGTHHYNKFTIIDELKYFETKLGFGFNYGSEENPNDPKRPSNKSSTIIPIGFGVGKSYNKTHLNQNLFNDNNLNVSLLNSKDNSFLELGNIFGIEANISFNDFSINNNNSYPKDGLYRSNNTLVLTDYFKSFVCYRLSGHTALEFGVKRNLIYKNADYVLTSLGSKAVETGYFYLLDYFVTQPLLKSGDENTYIYNFVMQNAASLIFYALKSDNYSFPLSGGKTYSAYNIYFGLRF